MTRTLAVLFLVALAGRSVAADKPTVKVEDSPPPKELAEPIRTLLDSKAMTVLDAKEKPICTVWVRKELPAKATGDQVTAGPKYTHIEESVVVGAVRFPQEWSDYRKQKIKPGVYTLRMGIQPMDGDHMGTAPYNEFLLLCPADKDKSAATMDADSLHELSTAATTRKHPGLMLLYPNRKPAGAPAVESRPNETWLVSFKLPLTADGKKADLGFSLVVIGHSPAE
jgi:hypothetical protein